MASLESIKGLTKNMSNRKSKTTTSSILGTAFIKILVTLIVVGLLYSFKDYHFSSTISGSTPSPSPLVDPTADPINQCIWQICSIDTMKTSRDLAREKLNDPSYDDEIKFQLHLIKQTGANYVAIDTPYNDEFLPYLKRWVNMARAENLHVWFRGNWSEWEGWFGYPKNMTPEQHLQKTADFIQHHPELFADGDIFDACPECENALWWPQPDKNHDYNQFIKSQHQSTSLAFQKINKKVITNIASIIGGRAKEVLDQSSLDALDKRVSIDHYIKDIQGMSDYLDYFKNRQTKVVVSEFGAPIPDINGNMTEDQQAEFVNQIFKLLYQNRDQVDGVNYYVLSKGTTELLNDDGSPRKAFNVVRNYFSPEVITGKITNPLGDKLANIKVKLADDTFAQTNQDGSYILPLPPQTAELTVDHPDYQEQKVTIGQKQNGEMVIQDFVITPTHPDLIYQLRMLTKKLF